MKNGIFPIAGHANKKWTFVICRYKITQQSLLMTYLDKNALRKSANKLVSYEEVFCLQNCHTQQSSFSVIFLK